MCMSVNTLEIVAILLLLINHSNALCEGQLFLIHGMVALLKAIPSDTLVTGPPGPPAPASSLFLACTTHAHNGPCATKIIVYSFAK